MSLQALLAALIVAACAGFLLRSVWRSLRVRSRSSSGVACGGCSGCSGCAGDPPREAVVRLHRRPR